MSCSKIYYEDPYKQVLDAIVKKVDCDKVYLDKTICYPEGGGQPGDRGTINDVPFIDTQKDKSNIYHVVPNNKFKVGDSVTIKLDWEHRYLYMKIHAAQHIISGILYNKFKIGTLSVHQGESNLTIEIDKNELSDDICYQIEDEANKSINNGNDINYKVMSEDEARKIYMRRSIKAHGVIRIVDIDNVDTIACGGLHVANTSEVGYILYVGQEIVRSHVRLIFKVADSAKKEVRTLQSIVNTLNVRHSSQTFEILDIDEKINDKLLQSEKENKTLQLAYSKTILENFIKESNDKIIMKDVSEYPLDLASFKDVIDDDIAILLIKKVSDGSRWLIYLGESYSTINIKQLKSEIFPLINAKGGGKPPFYQGKGEYKEIEKLFESFWKLINEKKSK
jgi:alanyl-tRNA synthetase